ncbi:MAG: hypothetical protein N2508_09125 [Anaerolineae bacterium]|nr:hypothetical protein [Anaerolineae bacterium]
MGHLMAAYTVFWGVVVGLLFSIWLRQRQLERALTALQARLGEGDDDE